MCVYYDWTSAFKGKAILLKKLFYSVNSELHLENQSVCLQINRTKKCLVNMHKSCIQYIADHRYAFMAKVFPHGSGLF